MAKQIKPRVEEISLAFDPANRKKFFMRKELSRARTPSFSGTETSSWVGVDKTFQAYRDGYYAHGGKKPDEVPQRVEDAPQDMKSWIASKSLLGEADAEKWEDLLIFPVVNPSTDKLNENALRAVLSGRGAQAKISSGALDSARAMARKLLDENFKKEEGGTKDMSDKKSFEDVLKEYKDQLTPETLKKALEELPEIKKDLPEMKKALYKVFEPEDVVGLFKDRKDELATEDFFKKLCEELPELKGVFEKDNSDYKMLKEHVKALESQIEKERDARRLMELRDVVKEKQIPGEVEKISKMMLTLEKMSPELAKDVMKVFGSMSEMVKASAAFTEIGSSGEGMEDDKDSAYAKLHALVKDEMKKDSSLSETKAWERVVRANPALYREYIRRK